MGKESGRTLPHECDKKETIDSRSKADGPGTFRGVSGAALTACWHENDGELEDGAQNGQEVL